MFNNLGTCLFFSKRVLCKYVLRLMGSLSEKATVPFFLFLTPFSLKLTPHPISMGWGVNILRKDHPFLAVSKLTPMWNGFVVQGSKQEITEVATLCKNGRK